MQSIAVDHDADLVLADTWDRGGKLLVQRGFTTLVTVHYWFQSGNNRVWFNNDQRKPVRFVFPDEDGETIMAMFARLEALLDAAQT